MPDETDLNSKVGWPVVEVPLGQIDLDPNAPAHTEDIVEEMEKSLRVSRIQQPPLVEAVGERFRVVFGNTRVRAAKKLGLDKILVSLFNGSDSERRLAKLDENLVRRPLSKAAEAQVEAERKRLYEERFPETRHGGNRNDATRQNGGSKRARPYAEVAANRSGKSPRTIQRRTKIAEHAIPTVQAAWDAKKITVQDAERLAGLSVEDQESKLRDLLAEKESITANEEAKPSTATLSTGAPEEKIQSKAELADVFSDGLRALVNQMLRHVKASSADRLQVGELLGRRPEGDEPEERLILFVQVAPSQAAAR